MRNRLPSLSISFAATAVLVGCSPSKPTGADAGPAPPAAPAVATDLQVLGPTAAIDPKFTPNPESLPKPVDRPAVESLTFARDGSRLVVRSLYARNGLQVWNVGDRPTLARSWDRRPGLGAPGVLSPDGKRFLYSAEGYWTQVIAEVDSGRIVTQMDALAGSEWAFAPADVLFGFHSSSDYNRAGKSQIITADATTGKKTALFEIHDGRGILRWSKPFADGRHVAVVHGGHPTIEVWDVLDQKRVRQVKEPFEHSLGPGGFQPFVNQAGTRMARGVPPGTKLAGADVGTSLIFWDGHSGEALAVVPGESGVFFADFLPGREVFLMASNALREQKREMSPEVIAYDIAKKAYSAVFRGGHSGHITALAVAHNGHWLATGDKDGKVQLWDLRQLR